MHSNTYDNERMRAGAEQTRAEKELVQIKNSGKKELAEIKSTSQIKQTEAIERLIAKGIDPVAARCAIEGWEKSDDGEICERVSDKGKLKGAAQ